MGVVNDLLGLKQHTALAGDAVPLHRVAGHYQMWRTDRNLERLILRLDKISLDLVEAGVEKSAAAVVQWGIPALKLFSS